MKCKACDGSGCGGDELLRQFKSESSPACRCCLSRCPDCRGTGKEPEKTAAIADLERYTKLKERIPEKCCLTCGKWRSPVTICVLMEGRGKILEENCNQWRAMP